MQKEKCSKNFKSGFTLLELLIVVLIIGILAAIALPQYKKIVLKANLYKGIPLVESLYQAQQLYYLEHGQYTTDIDALDIETPRDESCEKWESVSNEISGWDCKWGGVEVAGGRGARVNFLYPVHNSLWNSQVIINYEHVLVDWPSRALPNGKFVAGKRYCFARPNSELAQNVCKDIGGVYVGENGAWKYYEIQ